MIVPGHEKTFEHEGRMVTITQLALETGINRNTLSSRFWRGYRGADLVYTGKRNKWMDSTVNKPKADADPIAAALNAFARGKPQEVHL